MMVKNFSRCSASSCLESFSPRSFGQRPLSIQEEGNMTAAETTGPASGPQPASSAPATSERPCRHNSVSCESRCQYFAPIQNSMHFDAAGPNTAPVEIELYVG